MRTVLAASFCSAFLVATALALLIRKWAPKWGLVDHPGGRKRHDGAIPLGGGVAILLGTCGPVLGAGLLSWLQHWRPGILPFDVPASLAADVARAAGRWPLVLGVMAGGLAFAMLGLWDDAKDLPPRLKLGGQVLIALAVALMPGARITLFIPSAFVQVAVTVVWIVLMVNSFNLLDNMDGLSAGVGLICASIFCVVALQTKQYFVASLLLTFIGALGGFLVFNFNPASIFMGDTGALFLGYMMAVLTVLFTIPAAPYRLFSAVTPLLIMAVPLFDTISVVVIRLRMVVSPFVGDKNHSSLRLVSLGRSVRQAVWTIYLLTASIGLSATWLYKSDTIGSIVALVQALGVLSLLIVLEQTGKRVRENGQVADEGL